AGLVRGSKSLIPYNSLFITQNASSPVDILAQRITTLRGAYTGEVHIEDAIAAGVNGIIAGHSEARANFIRETDETINTQLLAALKHQLSPNILCVGETGQERIQGLSQEVVKTQLLIGLNGFNPEQVSQNIIAYEPRWAIKGSGYGKPAEPKDAQATAAFIREIIAKEFNLLAAEEVRIQYGGSVDKDNARDYLSLPDIDGFLVGGKSAKINDFIPILKVGEDIGPKQVRIPYIGANYKTYKIEDSFSDFIRAFLVFNSNRVQIGIAPSLARIKDLREALEKAHFGSLNNSAASPLISLEDTLEKLPQQTDRGVLIGAMSHRKRFFIIREQVFSVLSIYGNVFYHAALEVDARLEETKIGGIDFYIKGERLIVEFNPALLDYEPNGLIPLEYRGLGITSFILYAMFQGALERKVAFYHIDRPRLTLYRRFVISEDFFDKGRHYFEGELNPDLIKKALLTTSAGDYKKSVCFIYRGKCLINTSASPLDSNSRNYLFDKELKANGVVPRGASPLFKGAAQEYADRILGAIAVKYPLYNEAKYQAVIRYRTRLFFELAQEVYPLRLKGQWSLHLASGKTLLFLADALMGMQVVVNDIDKQKTIFPELQAVVSKFENELRWSGGKVYFIKGNLGDLFFKGRVKFDHLTLTNYFSISIPKSQYFPSCSKLNKSAVIRDIVGYLSGSGAFFTNCGVAVEEFEWEFRRRGFKFELRYKDFDTLSEAGNGLLYLLGSKEVSCFDSGDYAAVMTLIQGARSSSAIADFGYPESRIIDLLYIFFPETANNIYDKLILALKDDGNTSSPAQKRSASPMADKSAASPPVQRRDNIVLTAEAINKLHEIEQLNSSLYLSGDRGSNREYFLYIERYRIYNWILRLELLNLLGVVKGNLLYFMLGNDYFPSYYAMTIGTNFNHGLRKEREMDIKIKELENKAIQEGLPGTYKGKEKRIKIFDCDQYITENYFPAVQAMGRVNVILIKGLTTYSRMHYHNVPRIEGCRRDSVHCNIRRLLKKAADKLLIGPGFIILAHKEDLWLGEFLVDQLGFENVMTYPVFDGFKDSLLRTGIVSDSWFGKKVDLISGEIPIYIFQSTASSPLKNDKNKENFPTSQVLLPVLLSQLSLGFPDSNAIIEVTQAVKFGRALIWEFEEDESNDELEKKWPKHKSFNRYSIYSREIEEWLYVIINGHKVSFSNLDVPYTFTRKKAV
ncbi:MAG: triose-phosphate isomerase, partial [Candidatus Omnitrophica bacterium]|nr:triose-phosphate isomerase [Candidatus Omnitrophota bacterium]